jgi:hypothetical protein
MFVEYATMEPYISAVGDSGLTLLRLWLKMPNARKLAPEFPGKNGFILSN